MHNRMEPKYVNAVIKTNKLAHKLWHNCSSCGHTVKHNYFFECSLKVYIIGRKLSTISRSLVSILYNWLFKVSV